MRFWLIVGDGGAHDGLCLMYTDLEGGRELRSWIVDRGR